MGHALRADRRARNTLFAGINSMKDNPPRAITDDEFDRKYAHGSAGSSDTIYIYVYTYNNMST